MGSETLGHGLTWVSVSWYEVNITWVLRACLGCWVPAAWAVKSEMLHQDVSVLVLFPLGESK